MSGITVTRIAPGCYRVRAGDRIVAIDRFSRRECATFDGWIARAEWDNYLLTDPLPTYRAAKGEAIKMLGAN